MQAAGGREAIENKGQICYEGAGLRNFRSLARLVEIERDNPEIVGERVFAG